MLEHKSVKLFLTIFSFFVVSGVVLGKGGPQENEADVLRTVYFTSCLVCFLCVCLSFELLNRQLLSETECTFSLNFFSDSFAIVSLLLSSTLFSSFRIIRPSLRCPFVTMISLPFQ